MTPLPHDIRCEDGSPCYRCRVCRTAEKLHWYEGTSCPVCDKPACIDAVAAEYQAAYDSLSSEE